MKKIKLRYLLILLFISIFLSSGSLIAQPIQEVPSVFTNSIVAPFNNLNNWSISSFNSNTKQVNLPASTSTCNFSQFNLPDNSLNFTASQFNLPNSAANLVVNKSIWPSNPSYSSSGLGNLPATPFNWGTSRLDQIFSTVNSEGSKTDWTPTPTYSSASLLDFPATTRSWSTSQLNLPNSIDNWNITRSIFPFTRGNLSTTLWEWPAIAPVENIFDQLWEQVYEAIEKGLPKTAIALLEEIIPQALENEEYYGIALTAISKKLVLEANIQGNKPEEKIIRLTEEIEKVPDLLKPLLKLILAEWYWQYYQNNRWRFSERDATVNMSDTDFTTWDLPRLFDKIDELYTEVLSQEDLLKSVSVQEFADFFEKGTVTSSYRPTLFDFAAFSAISFFQDGDQLRKMPEDAFEMDAYSDALAQADLFIKYSPKTTDTSSPILKAMRIYQQLLDFHINDSSKEAFVDADINRLIFINAYSFGEEKSNRYMTRLSEIAETYTSMPLSSLAYYYWAQELYNQDDYLQAHNIAKKGEAQHANSYGSKMCRSLIDQIEAKQMTLRSEYFITPLYSEVRLDYKNITKVHLRIVEDNWDDFLEERYGSPDYINDDKYHQLINKTPIESWTIDLLPTLDYKTSSQTIDLPPLKPGYYRLFTSRREDFTEEENLIESVAFWVTEIAMVTKTINGVPGGFILDAHDGSPIEGAKINIFQLNRDGYYQNMDEIYTAKDGSFTIPPDYERSLILHVQYQEYELLSQSGYYRSFREDEDEDEKTIFFTDRSIYRPGQTIHFKVLAISSNQAKDTYNFIPNRKLTIELKDYNYQKVKDIDLVTNAFGSASGTFTAPSGKLTGIMTINCDNLRGSTTIRVEEYKRPKFKVTIDSPTKESRLDEEVEVSGFALAYSGAPIDQAKVSYRVIREVRYPFWCWWRCPPSINREIAHGILNTDAEGKFTIPFIARPDRSIPKSDEPTFMFQVIVNVTDSAGETRTGSQRINIGYVSMALDISTQDWLTTDKPIELGVSAMTLDQQPLKISGTLAVFNLKQPQSPVRSSLLGPPIGEFDNTIDESSWETWPEDEEIASSLFNTSEGEFKTSFTLEPGVYKVKATAYDSYGEQVKAMLPIMVIDPTAQSFNVPIPNLLKVKSTTLDVGDTLEAIWGTGYKEAHALIEIENRGKIVEKYWTDAQKTQQQIEWIVEEEHRGGFFLHITHVHDNRAYISKQYISVPWTNKDLDVSFSSFRSKLEPGTEETWTIKIKGPNSENVAAEMVATLYDLSLDAFSTHNWSGLGNIFRKDFSRLQIQFANRMSYPMNHYNDMWYNTYSDYKIRTYMRFPDDVLQNYGGYGGYGGGYGISYASSYSGGLSGGVIAIGSAIMDGDVSMYQPSPFMATTGQSNSFDERTASFGGLLPEGLSTPKGETYEKPKDEIDLSQVSTRTNLNETAFFFPHLVTDGEGEVSITFTIPEALTTWKFMGFAHANDLLWGMLSEETVTQKDFMVQPNPPRFLREGDLILFSTKVINLSTEEQTGIIRLSLSDTATLQSLDMEFLNGQTDQPFSVPAKSSLSYYFELEVPNYTGVLTYKVVASSGKLSDGEENVLPVLSSRIFVTESLPLPIRGAQTKTFSFDKLLESYESDTLEHQALTLQMVSNPAWYAVQSLPYLMEFPHECSEQIFNRIYANALAMNIANSDPKIKDIFSQWKETDALESNLEKNEELKSVILEETPWVRAAESESESKKRVGLLFDSEKMEESLSSAYDKLSQMQLSDGSWSWFPGGYSNSYITLYIMTGFGRLLHMNIDVNQNLALKCLEYLDNWINIRYEKIKEHENLDENNLTSTIAMYLYGRSFYLKEQPISEENQEVVNYFLHQASEYWLDFSSRLSQGHLALACDRFDDHMTAQDIMASLRERSINEEEMGMFWRDLEFSWWWYNAPIETQALMIEAFDEVADDQIAVEDLKVWLLKQKQTQNWKTTKSTADAVYALLIRGNDLLTSDELVKVILGGLEIVPDQIEAGTGFYEQKFIKDEVLPDYGQVTLEKVDEGIAWGSLHWQYLEDMSKVTPYSTPLQLEKFLYVERQSKEGPVIEPVEGNLTVGDLIVVRIVLRVDRDMEYVHMKDARGSGTEPVNVLSQYKYQDGLSYYESTGDTATNFFIDYLPKGTYVFEYPLRIQHKGEYQMGMTTIQCMYAPEFNSHSASEFINVQ